MPRKTKRLLMIQPEGRGPIFRTHEGADVPDGAKVVTEAERDKIIGGLQDAARAGQVEILEQVLEVQTARAAKRDEALTRLATALGQPKQDLLDALGLF